MDKVLIKEQMKNLDAIYKILLKEIDNAKEKNENKQEYELLNASNFILKSLVCLENANRDY